ncbi:hypothetical protein Lesp01_63180 [Lentzea sp. NBRC 102530]|nr:hypothetical protein Lesp01_63180 [Lentzea sp. NBRC 102530]
MQIPLEEWRPSSTEPLLTMQRSPQELTEQFGLDFADEVDDLGDVQVAVVRGSFGTAVLLKYAYPPFLGTIVRVDAAADFEAAHRAMLAEFGLTSADLGWARRSYGLLLDVQDNARLAELLATSFEFDVTRTETTGTESVEGSDLVVLAGDFTGGRFYRVAAQEEGPILHATSEGQAGLIADSLREALQLVIGLPYWLDCLTFSAGGDLDAMAAAARHLARENPDLRSRQAEAAELLSLDVPEPDDLLARLHAAASRPIVLRDETGEYEGLFGSFSPERNERWRAID